MTTRHYISNNVSEKLACIEQRTDSKSPDKQPVVILCHGFAYFKEEDGIFVEMANILSKLGYVVFYFDFSGCGESEGDYKETSLTKLIDDLRSVVDFVKNLDYCDEDNISFIGQSFGTNVIIGSQFTDAKRIVLCGSFDQPKKILSDLFPQFDEKGTSVRRRSDGHITKINPQFWKDLKQYNMKDLVKSFECPVLYVHGGIDTIVPIEYMLDLYQNTKNTTDPLILELSDHGLNPQRDLLYSEIKSYFRS